MNYYIQGNEDKADQIKAAFRELGYNTRRLDFSYGFFYTVERDVHYCVYDYMVNIIKTHPDYKEFELPIEPCFKVGDKIRSKLTQITYTINEIDIVNNRYKLDYCSVLDFKAQDKFELAPKPHYDISNFHAGMPVLVRADNDCSWDYSVFSRITDNEYWPFAVCNGVSFTQCIPFESNEHLLGTTDMPSEEYINW